MLNCFNYLKDNMIMYYLQKNCKKIFLSIIKIAKFDTEY